jgi:hypothetical protein
MKKTTALREAILLSLDRRFDTVGYRRRKGHQAWYRGFDSERTCAVHLNFGLYEREGEVGITPSVGVRYESIERALVESSVVTGPGNRDRVTFGKTLAALSGHEYQTHIQQGAEPIAAVVWNDWKVHGRPFLASISDLEVVIRLLRSPDPHVWCCTGRDFRARLLPLALEVAGRRHDALRILDELRADLAGRDQLRPPFDHFAAWFAERAA